MKPVFIVLVVLLLLSSEVFARDYIEVWPEGWSDVIPVFQTSIFADRFFVAHDSAGTSFLSVDGLYFKELDLTYRLVRNAVVEEEVVLCSQAEIDSASLGLDADGGRHVVWLERSPQGNTINHTTFAAPYGGHESFSFLETHHAIQDLAAYQVGKTTHVAWSERDGYFQIRYAQIENNEVILLETVTDTRDLSVKPSITVDNQGVVHLAWMETTDIGIHISYSTRQEGGWSRPRKVGDGSVQDVQQGGNISLAAFGNEVYLAWSALPRNSSRLFVFVSKVNAQGEIEAPVPFAMGSRAQFVAGVNGPELVWQGAGAFGAQINYSPEQSEITNLTVGRKGAFRPEAFSIDGFRYVYWLQAQSDGSFMVHGINNQFPKAISVWRKMGIDESAPVYHLLFLLMSTIMLATVYTIMNIGVMFAAGVIYSLLQRFGAYYRQPFFYQVALIATLLVVIRRLPVPSGNPEFFGLIHYGLSHALATLGTFMILRKVKQRGLFLTMGITITWMLLYQFFALIPQTILR